MADINKPAWRGAAGSTFQHWTFSTPPNLGNPTPAPWDPNLILPPDTEKMKPDEVSNSYGKPFLVVSDVDGAHNSWNPGYATRTGVWRLEPYDKGNAHLNGNMNMWIPNCVHRDLQKCIRVQVTYYRVTFDPDVSVIAQGRPVTEKQPVVQQLPQGWTHKTWEFWTSCDINGEQIDIDASGAVYIDQVVVDTYCPCDDRQRKPKRPPKRTRKTRRLT
ncbi:MAG TPA: hypothetical protein VEU32_13605 [Burkholderiales bacterium]|nr:hypothetical protein [Burkholderiales bacterium]